MPSETLPVKIRCVLCNDGGVEDCPQCDGSGQMKITECPEKLITDDIWEAIEASSFWEKGIPPVAGGMLDQTHIFIMAARIIISEQQYWKNELGILN